MTGRSTGGLRSLACAQQTLRSRRSAISSVRTRLRNQGSVEYSEVHFVSKSARTKLLLQSDLGAVLPPELVPFGTVAWRWDPNLPLHHLAVLATRRATHLAHRRRPTIRRAAVHTCPRPVAHRPSCTLIQRDSEVHPPEWSRSSVRREPYAAPDRSFLQESSPATSDRPDRHRERPHASAREGQPVCVPVPRATSASSPVRERCASGGGAHLGWFLSLGGVVA